MMNINVDQGEFNVAESGFTITTGYAVPCILIGVYDKKLKKAYLIHEDIAAHNGKLSEFIEKIKAESNIEDLIIKVRGGSGSKKDPDFDAVEHNRAAVENSLKDFPKKNIDKLWRKSCMGIDTETGKFWFRD